jgi:ABC-2 type transport system permease protein
MRVKVILSLVKNQIIAAKPLEQMFSSATKNGKQNKVIPLLLKIFGLLAISISFLFLIGSSYFGYLYISKALNIIEKGIALCAFTSTIFLLFISTTFLENVYFRGKDVSLWKLLPISKSEFFLARFFASYCYSLLTNIIVTVPLIVGIFVYVGISFLTILSSFILFFFLPLLPVVLSSLLVTIKVYIFKGKSIKIVDFLFNNLPFILCILYLSKSSNEMLEIVSSNMIQSQIASYQNYILNIGSLPYFSLIGKMFINGYSLLIFIIISLIVFTISSLIIAPLYEICLNFVNNANNKTAIRKKSNNVKDFNITKSPILFSLIKREFFIITSDKGFVSESFSEAFVPLILIIVWKITGSLDSINNLLDALASNRYFIPGVFLIIQMFAAMVLISSTSVSREGKLFKLNKLLPLRVNTIIKSKVLFHLLFVTVLQVIYLVAFIIFLKINLNLLFWMIPLFVLNSINISLSGLLIDYKNPRLEWDSATSAMKRNMNAFFGMGFALLVIAPSILVLFFFDNFLLLAFVISLLILVLLYKSTNKVASKILSLS